MDITIKDTNASRTCIERNKIIWKLFMSDYWKGALVLCIVGALSIILDLRSPPTTSYQSYTNNIATKVVNIDLHLFTSVGIAFILTGALYFIRIRKNKNEFNKKVRVMVTKYLLGSNETIIRINDDGVRYQNDYSEAELKWSAFSTFTITDNTLFLNVASMPGFHSVAIARNLMNPKDFSEVFAFVRNKVPLMKGNELTIIE